MTIKETIDEARTLMVPDVKTSDEKIFINIKNCLRLLYSNFDIKINEYLVEMSSLQTEYKLPDDTLKVLSCYAEPESNVVVQLALNNSSEINSIFTPVYNILQVPNPSDFSAIDVIYRAKHTELVFDNIETQELELPPMLYECLYFYIAKNISTSIDARKDYAYKFKEAYDFVVQSGTFDLVDIDVNNIALKGYI